MSLKDLNEFIKDYLWMDLEIKSFVGSNLLIVGAIDLTYSHEIELLFSNVTYIRLGQNWTWDKKDKKSIVEEVDGIYFCPEKERKKIQENFYIVGTQLYRFNGEEHQEYYVIAESLRISRNII